MAMMITIAQIKQLRDKTGAPIMECKKALGETKGNFSQAEKLLKKWGVARAKKKKGRETGEGLIYAYIHHGGKVGALIEVSCETDFVARNKDFIALCKEIAMQVASMNPQNVEKLLDQEYIRDPKFKIKDYIDQEIGLLGENIVVRRFCRFKLGE